ncbi:hypothetical protein [Archangium primigenium]|uniref:hypothetical protein n=1 Tax=[Archangium] primigenium TaxID=2792470 RepID=UPI001EF7E715|nr:hypothetical protein [Archangium primigenium]
MRLSGALACVEEREDTAAFLARPGPRRHLSPRALGASLLVLGSAALAVLLLWTRTLAPEVQTRDSEGMETVAGEPVSWVDLAPPPRPAPPPEPRSLQP